MNDTNPEQSKLKKKIYNTISSFLTIISWCDLQELKQLEIRKKVKAD